MLREATEFLRGSVIPCLLVSLLPTPQLPFSWLFQAPLAPHFFQLSAPIISSTTRFLIIFIFTVMCSAAVKL
jgi:hypothetical protein